MVHTFSVMWVSFRITGERITHTIIAQSAGSVVALRLSVNACHEVVGARAVIIAINRNSIALSSGDIANSGVAGISSARHQFVLAIGLSVVVVAGVSGTQVVIIANNGVNDAVASITAGSGVARVRDIARLAGECAIAGGLLAFVVSARIVVVTSHKALHALARGGITRLGRAKSSAAGNIGVNTVSVAALIGCAQVAIVARLGGIGASDLRVTGGGEASISGGAGNGIVGAVGSTIRIGVAVIVGASIVIIAVYGDRGANIINALAGGTGVGPCAGSIVARHTVGVSVVLALTARAGIGSARVKIIARLCGKLATISLSTSSNQTAIVGAARLVDVSARSRIANIVSAHGAGIANDGGELAANLRIADEGVARIGSVASNSLVFALGSTSGGIARIVSACILIIAVYGSGSANSIVTSRGIARVSPCAGHTSTGNTEVANWLKGATSGGIALVVGARVVIIAHLVG